MGPRDRKALTAMFTVLAALSLALVPIEGEGASEGPDTECESCHEDFVPFVAVGKADEFVPDEPLHLKCTISNPGEHLVIGAFAWVESPKMQSDYEVDEAIFSGNIGPAGPISYVVEVEQGAKGMTVALQEDQPRVGLSDAILTVTLPDGSTVTSDTGAEEKIDIDENELSDQGPGDYTVTIELARGFRPLAYQLRASVLYSPGELYVFMEDIGPGESVTRHWNLTISAEQFEGLKMYAAGTALHPHGEEEERDTHSYRLEVELNAQPHGGGDRKIRTPLKTARNSIGYTMVCLFIASVLTGWPRTRALIPGLKASVSRGLHCYISWAMVILMGVHAYLASFTHSIRHPAVQSGIAMAVVFVFLALFPYMKGLRGAMKDKLGLTKFTLVVILVMALLFIDLAFHIVA